MRRQNAYVLGECGISKGDFGLRMLQIAQSFFEIALFTFSSPEPSFRLVSG